MDFKHWCLGIGVLLLVLAMTVFAHAADNNADFNGIYISSEDFGLSLEKCVTRAEHITIKNYSFEKKCVDFDVTSAPNNSLQVSLTNSKTCLNKGESTIMTLNINTCYADLRSYTVRVYDHDKNLSLPINVSVGNTSSYNGIRLDEMDAIICSGEIGSIPIAVRNTSSVGRDINLSAENSMLLPYFERQKLFFNAGEQKVVDLKINAVNLPAGFNGVTLFASNGDYTVSKRITVEVVDCSVVPNRTFFLSTPSVCFNAHRGQKLQVQFNITRQSDPADELYYNARDFYLSASGFPTELSYTGVSLLPNRSKQVTAYITVPSDAVAGRSYLSITGSDSREIDAFTENKNICIDVAGEYSAGLFVNTQAKDILAGNYETFELEAVNNGDLDANFTLAVEFSFGATNVTLSNTKIFLAKGESRPVFVTINPTRYAQVKDSQYVIVRMDGPVDSTAQVFYNVLGNTVLDDLQVLSSSSKLTVRAGNNAEYSVLIRNNSGSDFNDVTVSLEGLPADINSSAVSLGKLASGKVASISGKIVVGRDANEGTFVPTILIKSGSKEERVPLTLVVAKGGIGEGTGLFAFFAFGEFGSDGFIAAVIAAVIMILVLALVVAIIAKLSKHEKSEKVWVAK